MKTTIPEQVTPKIKRLKTAFLSGCELSPKQVWEHFSMQANTFHRSMNVLKKRYGYSFSKRKVKYGGKVYYKYKMSVGVEL